MDESRRQVLPHRTGLRNLERDQAQTSDSDWTALEPTGRIEFSQHDVCTDDSLHLRQNHPSLSPRRFLHDQCFATRTTQAGDETARNEVKPQRQESRSGSNSSASSQLDWQPLIARAANGVPTLDNGISFRGSKKLDTDFSQQAQDGATRKQMVEVRSRRTNHQQQMGASQQLSGSDALPANRSQLSPIAQLHQVEGTDALMSLVSSRGDSTTATRVRPIGDLFTDVAQQPIDQPRNAALHTRNARLRSIETHRRTCPPLTSFGSVILRNERFLEMTVQGSDGQGRKTKDQNGQDALTSTQVSRKDPSDQTVEVTIGQKDRKFSDDDQTDRGLINLHTWLGCMAQRINDLTCTDFSTCVFNDSTTADSESGFSITEVQIRNLIEPCALITFPQNELHNCDVFSPLQRSVQTTTTQPASDTEVDVFPGSSSTMAFVFWKNGIRKAVPEDVFHDSPEIATQKCKPPRSFASASSKTPRQMKCALPLAPVASPSFDFEAFRELWKEISPPTALIEMTDWMTTDKLSTILRRQEFHQELDRDCITRNIQFDINPLVRSGTVETVASLPQGYGITNLIASRVFTVPKSDGATSRFIWDGRAFNEIFHTAMGKPPDMPLPRIPEVIDQILDGWKVISTNDVKSMFFQFPVHNTLRKFFGFGVTHKTRRSEVELFRLCALPMGVCFAPTFAQHVSNFICDVIRRRVPSHTEFYAMAWIDNFIVCTNSAQDDICIRQQLDSLFQLLQLQMKGWEGGASQLDVLGIHFDLSSRLATPTQLAKDKLQQRTLELQQRNGTDIRNATFIRWFGQVQWFCYSTARIPLCFCPNVMSTIRRICSKEDWFGTLDVEAAFFSEVNAITNACLIIERKASSNISLQPRIEIWSDASTKAIAAVHPQQHRAFSQRISCTDRQICYAEMLAGLLGFRFLAHANTWVTDNMAAARSMVRGHCGSATCDALLRLWLCLSPTPLFVTWVDSDCNIADPLTRDGTQVQKPCCSPHLYWQTRWGAEGVAIIQNTRESQAKQSRRN